MNYFKSVWNIWGLRFASLFISQILTLASQFFYIFIISVFCSPTSVGLYGIITAIVNPIQAFLLFDAGNLLITEKKFKELLPSYHGFFLLNSIFVIPLSIFAFYCLGSDESELFGVFGFASYKAVWNYKEYVYSIYQKSEQVELISKSMNIFAIISIIVFAVSFYAFKSIGLSFTLITSALIITIVFFDFKNVKKLGCPSPYKFTFSKGKIGRIYSSGLKLGINAFVNSFRLNAPRYFAEYFLHDRLLLASITLYTQIVTGYALASGAINRTIMGKLVNTYYENIAAFRRLFKKVVTLNLVSALVLWVGIFLFARGIIQLIFGTEYIAAITVLYLITLAKSVSFPLPILKNMLILFKKVNFIYLSNIAAAILTAGVVLVENDNIVRFSYYFLVIELTLAIAYLATNTKSMAVQLESRNES